MTPTRNPLHPSTLGLVGRARQTLVAAAVATALGVFSVPAMSADSADLQGLQDQINKLQREMDRMKAQQAQQAQQPQATPAPTAAAKPASGGAAAPTFMAGPVKVTLGGFVELMVIDRNRNESADWASNYNTGIPFPNSHNYYVSEFHLTERQSRVQALFQGPDNESWATEAYIESDFGGAGGTANYNESNSFSPRMRHYFADLTYKPTGSNLLFGQLWSLVTGNKTGITPRGENIPLTIDGQYVPGFNWLRVPQIRFTQKVNDMITAAVSVENPAALVSGTAVPGTIFNNPGAGNSFSPPNGGAFAANNVTLDYLPDFVAKVAIDPGFGHYELFATERFFRARDIITGQQTNAKSNATAFGGNMILPVVPKIVDFQASFLGGRGVGRYGSTQLPDATINPDSSRGLEPLRGFSALAGLVVKPDPALTLYAYVGEEQVSKASWTVTAGGKTTNYGYGNPLYDNTGCFVEGGTACAANTSRIVSGAVGGWWKFYSGFLGNAQFGLADTWLKREIFSGKGGDPSTNINILMASFRYYPFQK